MANCWRGVFLRYQFQFESCGNERQGFQRPAFQRRVVLARFLERDQVPEGPGHLIAVPLQVAVPARLGAEEIRNLPRDRRLFRQDDFHSSCSLVAPTARACVFSMSRNKALQSRADFHGISRRIARHWRAMLPKAHRTGRRLAAPARPSPVHLLVLAWLLDGDQRFRRALARFTRRRFCRGCAILDRAQLIPSLYIPRTNGLNRRSCPIVVASPCPAYTIVSSGRV